MDCFEYKESHRLSHTMDANNEIIDIIGEERAQQIYPNLLFRQNTCSCGETSVASYENNVKKSAEDVGNRCHQLEDELKSVNERVDYLDKMCRNLNHELNVLRREFQALDASEDYVRSMKFFGVKVPKDPKLREQMFSDRSKQERERVLRERAEQQKKIFDERKYYEYWLRHKRGFGSTGSDGMEDMSDYEEALKNYWQWGV